MKRHIAPILALAIAVIVLGACSPTIAADGQLFCALGPANVVALVDPAGAPIMAKASTKAYVDTACQIAGGVTVSPPSAPVRSVIITPPRTISIPL